jgi:predicted dithiol-disulfide oxidoreductase (DUF899 family)
MPEMLEAIEKQYPGESDEYRRARNGLLEAEIELRRQEEVVAEQRRKLPTGGEVPEDYAFEEWDGASCTARQVRLSELFDEGKDSLFLYSFMFNPGPDGPLQVACPSCTAIIDGIDGAVPYITRDVNFAVSTKAPIERFNAHARARGWRNARLLSSAKTSYNADYRTETSDAEQWPLATVFERRDGRIHHVWSSELFNAPAEPGQAPRHVDFMWPLWKVLDTTPTGRGEQPELPYPAGQA